MTNIYGAKLDQNGYAPSIMYLPNDGDADGCFVCGNGGDLARHEIYFGTAYRNRSKELGLWIRVCPACHDEIHNGDKDLDRQLKELAQEHAMNYYGWNVQDFRNRFGKNWL